MDINIDNMPYHELVQLVHRADKPQIAHSAIISYAMTMIYPNDKDTQSKRPNSQIETLPRILNNRRIRTNTLYSLNKMDLFMVGPGVLSSPAERLNMIQSGQCGN